MYILKIIIVLIILALLNKILIILKKYLEKKTKTYNMYNSILTRKDLLDFGMDYYLTLCKYIILEKGLSKEVYIQDTTGREIVDIKFINEENDVYVSCILKDILEKDEFEKVTYDEVMDLLSCMIKDNVSRGIIFHNSDMDRKASDFINSLNKNSQRYRIDIIDGYEIIKFGRKRNERAEGEINYA